jgi:hypothetical protein
MEENKNIETEAPEKLEDNDLESAAGGCTFGCDYEEIRCWTGVMNNYDSSVSRTFKVLRCKNCGNLKYMRSTRDDGEPDARDREISRDEYEYYSKKIFWF